MRPFLYLLEQRLDESKKTYQAMLATAEKLVRGVEVEAHHLMTTLEGPEGRRAEQAHYYINGFGLSVLKTVINGGANTPGVRQMRSDQGAWVLQMARPTILNVLCGHLLHSHHCEQLINSEAFQTLDAYRDKLSVEYQQKVGEPSETNINELWSTMQEILHWNGIEYPPIQNYRFDMSASPQQIRSELRALEEEYKKAFGGDKALKAQEGDKVILDFPETKNSPHYVWMALSRAYCQQEADAMGHCGNSPSKHTQERILSFRRVVQAPDGQPRYIPHLTFIIDEHGHLGEMKGRANERPTEKYHKYIVELMKLPLVKGIIPEAGYLTDNNFALDQLDYDTMDDLLAEKPELRHPKDYYDQHGIDEYFMAFLKGSSRGKLKSLKFEPIEVFEEKEAKELVEKVPHIFTATDLFKISRVSEAFLNRLRTSKENVRISKSNLSSKEITQIYEAAPDFMPLPAYYYKFGLTDRLIDIIAHDNVFNSTRPNFAYIARGDPGTFSRETLSDEDFKKVMEDERYAKSGNVSSADWFKYYGGVTKEFAQKMKEMSRTYADGDFRRTFNKESYERTSAKSSMTVAEENEFFKMVPECAPYAWLLKNDREEFDFQLDNEFAKEYTKPKRDGDNYVFFNSSLYEYADKALQQTDIAPFIDTVNERGRPDMDEELGYEIEELIDQLPLLMRKALEDKGIDLERAVREAAEAELLAGHREALQLCLIEMDKSSSLITYDWEKEEDGKVKVTGWFRIYASAKGLAEMLDNGKEADEFGLYGLMHFDPYDVRNTWESNNSFQMDEYLRALNKINDLGIVNPYPFDKIQEMSNNERYDACLELAKIKGGKIIEPSPSAQAMQLKILSRSVYGPEKDDTYTGKW